MSIEVPEGWQYAKLGDIITLEYGRSLPDKARRPGAVPVFGSNGVVGWHDEALVPSGGIIVGRKGTAGSVTVSLDPFWPIDTTYYVKPRKSVDADWLAATLHHVRLNELNEATGVPGLNRDKAYLQPIVLPPLDEQRWIAEVLRSVDEAIARTQAVVDATVATQQATFAAFLRSGDSSGESDAIIGWTTGKIDGVERLPQGWQIAKLVDVARLESGHTPDRQKPEYWSGGDIEWISLHDTKNLEQADISQTEMRITRAGLTNSSARLLPAGTVCFSRTATVGKCVIMAMPMATSQDFANFVCSAKLNNRYLLHLMRWMQPVWKSLASGSTHQTIYMPTFKALQIVLPTRADQDAIAETMDGFVSVTNGYAKQLERLHILKTSLTSDLLSGRVRVPVPAMTTPEKTVPPAFKRAVFAAEIVHQLHNDNRFGSVKHEKIVHLCELHLGLQADLDRHAYKEAAGPYDPKARRSVERIFQQQKWFDATKPDGNRVVYVPLEKEGGHAEYFDRYFGDQKPAIQSIIDLLRPLNTEQCEIVATLYAVWNDFLIDKRQPSDDEIVASVLQWHPKKQQITEDRWLAALPWMRQKGLIPKGTGEKTRVAQA
jgi:type I restriction enzyme S subunit